MRIGMQPDSEQGWYSTFFYIPRTDGIVYLRQLYLLPYAKSPHAASAW